MRQYSSASEVNHFTLAQTFWLEFVFSVLCVNILSIMNWKLPTWYCICGRNSVARCFVVPTTASRGTVSQLSRGYQIRERSKGAKFAISCRGTRSRINRERDMVVLNEHKIWQIMSEWAPDRGLWNCVKDRKYRYQFWTKTRKIDLQVRRRK